MSSDDAAGGGTLRCPVCRARQRPDERCRRCAADLRLVVRAHERVAHLLRRRRRAAAAGDDVLGRAIDAELAWLAPGR